MLKTPERRRQWLVAVVGILLFHACASEWLLPREDVSDPELRQELGEFYDEYRALWGR